MTTQEQTAATEVHLLEDDGVVPNNADLPLILYRGVLDVSGTNPEAAVRDRFMANGWGNSWVDGIFPYHHYHSTAHEVLGIASGWASVQFGGRRGPVAEVNAGDAVLIPAGVGHCRLGSEALSVVGAYPPGQDWDLRRTTAVDRETALKNLPHVPLPETDPLFGSEGPVPERWLSR